MRGTVTEPPMRVSAIARPLACMAFNTCATVASAFALRITAHAPATCGVAMDVPDKLAYELMYDEKMLPPGASKSSNRSPFAFGALLAAVGAFENDETPSLYASLMSVKSVDPTAMADEIQAGNAMASFLDAFPLAITVAILTLRN